ncbi:WecB/TagA/CpsF family glycosyltransferase [Patescibacteria group bacterium]|nr:WecB/TagA/CpsF family glycosyltransferase [Patescibacteria group bacterium]
MYILGVKIDNLDIKESLQKISSFLINGRQHYIVLPYAAFLVQAQKDEEFRKILNQADLSLPDGIGPVLASRIIGQEMVKGRITGIDLIWALFDKFGAAHSVFLFGAKEGVAQEAAEKIAVKYPTAKIVGTLNGYVNDTEAITVINNSDAEILLVALGMPKQEKWIYNNLKKLPAIKLAIGVGGSFDFISGRVRRAPKIVQKMGLEWLWRLFRQPNQWRKTWRSVIVFSRLVLKEKF